MSRLAQARGLKHYQKTVRRRMSESRLAQARGLKLLDETQAIKNYVVAPRTGAWIETICGEVRNP